MDEHISASVAKVAECADAIDRLSESLDTYTGAYQRLLDTMDTFRQKEEQSVSVIQETVPQLQQHVETVNDAQAEFDRHLEGFRQSMEQGKPFFEHVEQLMQQAEKQLQATIGVLNQHETVWRDMETSLGNIEEKLASAPQLAESSVRIQNALCAISDPEKLEEISQKLTKEIAEIHQEKREIIAPLKSAAAFSAVVREENQELTEHISKTLDSAKQEVAELVADGPESITGKLDHLLAVSEELKAKIDGMEAPHGKPSGFRGIFGLNSKTEETRTAEREEPSQNQPEELKQLVLKSICVVEKTSWYDDYVFAVESVENNMAVGYIYKSGKQQSRKEYPIHTGDFRFYHGTYLQQILENEYRRRF